MSDKPGENDFYPAFQETLKSEKRKFGDIFPDEKIRKLATEIRLPHSKLGELKNFLRFYGSQFLADRIEEALPITKSEKKQFQAISNTAKKLSKLTAHVGNKNYLEKQFWQPLNEINQPNEILRSKGMGRFSRLARHATTPSDGDMWFPVEKEHILQCVELIEYLATTVQRMEPTDKGGRPLDAALRNLVVGARAFWAENIGSGFSRETHDGIPTSRALLFCVLVARELDPELTTSQVRTAIKRLMTNRNTKKA